MLTISEFNDKVSEVNQSIFDRLWVNFPGMFKIKQDFVQNGKHYLQIESDSLGSITFQIKVDGNIFALDIKLYYESADCYDKQDEKIFNEFVMMFRD